MQGQRTTSTERYLYPLVGLPRVITIEQGRPSEPSPLEDGVYRRREVSDNLWTVEVSESGRPFPHLSRRITSTYQKGFVPQLPPAPPIEGEERLQIVCQEGFDVDLYGNQTRHSKILLPST